MTQPVNIIQQKQHLSLSSGTEAQKTFAAGNVHIQQKRNSVFGSSIRSVLQLQLDGW